MSDEDPNLYELIVHSSDSRDEPQIITVSGTNPDELIDAAQHMDCP